MGQRTSGPSPDEGVFRVPPNPPRAAVTDVPSYDRRADALLVVLSARRPIAPPLLRTTVSLPSPPGADAARLRRWHRRLLSTPLERAAAEALRLMPPNDAIAPALVAYAAQSHATHRRATQRAEAALRAAGTALRHTEETFGALRDAFAEGDEPLGVWRVCAETEAATLRGDVMQLAAVLHEAARELRRVWSQLSAEQRAAVRLKVEK